MTTCPTSCARFVASTQTALVPAQISIFPPPTMGVRREFPTTIALPRREMKRSTKVMVHPSRDEGAPPQARAATCAAVVVRAASAGSVTQEGALSRDCSAEPTARGPRQLARIAAAKVTARRVVLAGAAVGDVRGSSIQ